MSQQRFFPEGRLTKNSDIDSFRPSIERILAQMPGKAVTR